jgi:hypothetical protein
MNPVMNCVDEPDEPEGESGDVVELDAASPGKCRRTNFWMSTAPPAIRTIRTRSNS